MKQHWIRWCAALCAALFLSVEAAAAPKMLIPGGCTIGMKLDTQGVLVTGFAEESSAERAGLKKGDVIIEVDGEAVHTVAALQESLEESQVVLTVLRNGKEAEFCVNPQKTADGSRLGAYVRDSVAGIGTVTYYDPNTGNFGALGHGVNDAETSILMPLEAGVVVRSTVSQVEKGKVGKPGELRGVFHVDDILGEVSANTEQGVFGRLTTPVAGTPVPVASPEEVHPGEAEIRCNVSDHEVATYCVEIEKVFSNTSHTGRNLMLKITDPALLAATGGIVQGMGVSYNRDNTGTLRSLQGLGDSPGFSLTKKNLCTRAGTQGRTSFVSSDQAIRMKYIERRLYNLSTLIKQPNIILPHRIRHRAVSVTLFGVFCFDWRKL